MMQMDTQTILILIAIAAVILLAALLLLRGRRQRVALGREDAAPLEKRSFAPRDMPAPAPVTAPSTAPATDTADPLTRIKGLGPKAAARLGELGVTRFAELAVLDEAGIARIDDQMGTFKGRILRDRWVEQAALLAADDTSAFEARFGKLG